MKPRGFLLALGLAFAALGAFIIPAPSRAETDASVVRIDNFTFSPPELTVKAGTTVTWENGDDIPHSIVESATKFRSKALDTGETFSMTFASVGEIDYFCGLHPHMKGKIIVKP